jgi:hypothetical protein
MVCNPSTTEKPFENRIYDGNYQVDEMVYKLYGLSEDEVAVVEGRG